MIKGWLNGALGIADQVGAALSPGIWPESDSLITLLFHGLFHSQSEALSGKLDPQQQVTQDDFRSCIESLISAGYTFIDAAEAEAGAASGRKYAMLTFDDGYFNNTLALDALAEFRVPAMFYVATNPVLRGESFWWDVAYRAGGRAGWSAGERSRKLKALKGMRHEAIASALRGELGPDAFRPTSDVDRPFTPGELKDFARHPWVRIGNHTCDHVILPMYSEEEMAAQIRGCQHALRDLLGAEPTSIAYPNGDFDRRVVKVAKAEGLRSGITLVPRRNSLPLEGDRRMAIGRFTPWGGRDMASQCRVFRSPISASNRIKAALKPGY